VHDFCVGRFECARSHDIVGVEREYVDPMAVTLKRTTENAVVGTPHFDGPVLRGRVDEVRSPPAETRHGHGVRSEGHEARAREGVPNANVAVFRGTGQLATDA
jgi:hypothetical protein